ncbi:universal stress protein [Gammaproteobacteria bacterium]|jgi:universal stress protein E|nr:universal stress protein [Gammaproteobacteria bacterium]
MSETVLAVIQLDNFPQHVANRAAWIARLFGYDLHLLLSDPSLAVLRDSFIVSNEAKEIARSIETAQQQLLDDLKNAVSENGEIQVTTTITHDRPAHDAIIAQALEIEPKVVVKGTQYHSPAERATFAYTDWQLIRKLNAPLWFVKPNDWKDAPVLVAAVDPTHRHDKAGTLDQKIIDFGKSIASKCGGHLILLHTYQRLVEIGTYAKFKFKPVKLPIDELDKNIRAEHRQKLDALAAANDIPADAVHQLPGRTHDILPTFARTRGADLVIMGALARSGLRQRTLGSTAERVLDHLHCDILIARSD